MGLAAQNNVECPNSPGDAAAAAFLKCGTSSLCSLHLRNKIEEATGS